MAEPIISLEHVTFQYPTANDYAVKDICIDVLKGEWLAIVGHNGSGKSTLARLLNGLHYPQAGTVKVDGFVLNDETVWDIRKKIGMVFQNPDNQFVGTTVKDDVAFGLENNGIPQEEMAVRVPEALEKVKMGEFLDQEPHHLSGGQKQRVAIAGVLALRPSIIILDEATSMLDPKGREEVLETVRLLKEEKTMTVVSITHDLDEAAKADRIIVMNKGKVYREGNPEEIFALDEELLSLGLDIPFSVKMGKALKERGIELSKNYLAEEELVRELWIYHSKR
ncbi:energy-coupling factor transporter ATPase [Bacillus sp. FJAT-27225]|uniref:energy-coupling factor ABC transporter ATP-binding protein n=1 Tax=Bacillus sp. FJAT-27225 TaxID=1743144 RepID=UPI00080C2CAB|nr:energy-coupling factor ABC transporter ATP-binding protein [Bacillus sp. FJAT-27225]OCA80993.1 energy-coupling factor transporter ATPase [Bacillus sp. FJAT-27225]